MLSRESDIDSLGIQRKRQAKAATDSSRARLTALQQAADNSPQNRKSNRLQRMANDQFDQHHPNSQSSGNNTGLPDKLKNGMENLSGMSLDHVRVHYGSTKPAALQAHAYAVGSDIHIAKGQERHLPHELGHVVQQAEGRVRPTRRVNGLSISDDVGLEHEASEMGVRALDDVRQEKRLMHAEGIVQHVADGFSYADSCKSAGNRNRLPSFSCGVVQRISKEELVGYFERIRQSLQKLSVEASLNKDQEFYFQRVSGKLIVLGRQASELEAGDEAGAKALKKEWIRWSKTTAYSHAGGQEYIEELQSVRTRVNEESSQKKQQLENEELRRVEAGARAQRKADLRRRNDAAVRGILQQVVKARKVSGQEHYNAGSNKHITIEGGTDNPLRLEHGDKVDDFRLTDIVSHVKASDSAIAKVVFVRNTGNILVHVQ